LLIAFSARGMVRVLPDFAAHSSPDTRRAERFGITLNVLVQVQIESAVADLPRFRIRNTLFPERQEKGSEVFIEEARP
jgi:hypothetical protein